MSKGRYVIVRDDVDAQRVWIGPKSELYRAPARGLQEWANGVWLTGVWRLGDGRVVIRTHSIWEDRSNPGCVIGDRYRWAEAGDIARLVLTYDLTDDLADLIPVANPQDAQE